MRAELLSYRSSKLQNCAMLPKSCDMVEYERSFVSKIVECNVCVTLPQRYI